MLWLDDWSKRPFKLTRASIQALIWRYTSGLKKTTQDNIFALHVIADEERFATTESVRASTRRVDENIVWSRVELKAVYSLVLSLESLGDDRKILAKNWAFVIFPVAFSVRLI